MNATVEDLRSTIIPKSDQLNAEQLLAGPITVTVTDVRVGSSDEQPIAVHYEGENGRPFKPCKTMRKVLIFAWGPDGREWIGRSLQLYNDPQVKFGGAEVGGIRISHMSDIERDIEVSLTATKGKKALHRIRKLKVDSGPAIADVLDAIAKAQNRASMETARLMASSLRNERDIAAARTAYQARAAELKKSAAPKLDLPAYTELVDNAVDADAAAKVMADAEKALSADDLSVLREQFQMAWGA